MENKEEKIVSREKLAEIIWVKDISYYTDWALDQIMRRIRNKFVNIGLDRQLIRTIKNQGYSFNK